MAVAASQKISKNRKLLKKLDSSLKPLTDLKQELPVAAMFVNGSK
jgi:hypothetical protein